MDKVHEEIAAPSTCKQELWIDTNNAPAASAATAEVTRQIKRPDKWVTTFLFQWLPQIIKRRMTMLLRPTLQFEHVNVKSAGINTGEMIPRLSATQEHGTARHVVLTCTR